MALVDAPVSVVLYTVAFEQFVYEVALIPISICLFVNTIAISIVVAPGAIVLATVGPLADTISIEFSIKSFPRVSTGAPIADFYLHVFYTSSFLLPLWGLNLLMLRFVLRSSFYQRNLIIIISITSVYYMSPKKGKLK